MKSQTRLWEVWWGLQACLLKCALVPFQVYVSDISCRRPAVVCDVDVSLRNTCQMMHTSHVVALVWATIENIMPGKLQKDYEKTTGMELLTREEFNIHWDDNDTRNQKHDNLKKRVVLEQLRKQWQTGSRRGSATGAELAVGKEVKASCTLKIYWMRNRSRSKPEWKAKRSNKRNVEALERVSYSQGNKKELSSEKQSICRSASKFGDSRALGLRLKYVCQSAECSSRHGKNRSRNVKNAKKK